MCPFLCGGNMVNFGEIFRYFPTNIAILLDKELKRSDVNYNLLEEIRLRVNQPMLLRFGQEEDVMNHLVQTEEILETLQHICDNSIYSYQKQICNGYITVKGGHRIGISGSVVMTEEKISNMNYISQLNFRIARQVLGCSNRLIPYVVNSEENTIFHTLIVSEPGAGKTTILRDLIRRISDGIEAMNLKGKTVAMVDERGELAAMYRGIPQNDIGMRTDVLDNVQKDVGMKMLIRSMSPQVIVADEIGSKEDVQAIQYAVCCGIKGVFTAHGGSIEEIRLNPALSELIEKTIFERIIFLNQERKGEIKKVYALNKRTGDYVVI